MKGIVCTTEDELEIRDFAEPLHKTLGEAVGGWIEIVHPVGMKRPFVMIVNEEGLLHDLDINALGSFLYGTLAHGNPIVGDIVIMKEGFVDGEPDIVGLTDQEADAFMDLFKKTLVRHNERSN